MQSVQHKWHIETRTAHNSCPECRADSSRRFAVKTPFHYDHVSTFLAWIRPRLEAIRNGNNTVDARIWHRDFTRALA